MQPAVSPQGDLLQRLEQATSGVPIVSFDIFDTAIERVLARPEDGLLAVGARAQALGLIACAPGAFREYRLAAEQAMRQRCEANGQDEVRLGEIYDYLAACHVTGEPQRLAALELAVERAVCRPITALRDVVARCRARQRVVFISDTTLPADWLRHLLADAGYGKDCQVFCSADARLSKHTGRMFPHVLQQLRAAPKDLLHVGDNPVSDVVRPKAHGIAAFQLPYPRSRPEDPALADRHHAVRLLDSARRARGRGRPAPKVAPLGQYFSALLLGFTLFVLDEARRRGISRIYFLARDGYLPLELARRIAARRGDDLELVYLHVSRRSIMMPAQTDTDVLARDVADSMGGRPLGEAFDFLEVERQETARLARQLGLDPDLRINGKPGEDACLALFRGSAGLVATRLAAARANAVAYLRAQRFLEPGPRLIVDVGWKGSIQKGLAALGGVPEADIIGCYLGLWPSALTPAISPRNAVAYAVDYGYPRDAWDAVQDGYVLLELFFSAPHPTVLSYAERDGRMQPVLAGDKDTALQHAFSEIEATCLAEFELLEGVLDGQWPTAIDARSAFSDMRGLLTRPNLDEVRTFGAIRFIQGVDGLRSAPPISPISLRRILRDPAAAIRRLERAPWRAGSVRASLPRLVPDMTFDEFRYRLERLARLLRR